jgi:hypothetical protein
VSDIGSSDLVTPSSKFIRRTTIAFSTRPARSSSSTGSTDGTRAVLESYGNQLRWVSEPDKGQVDDDQQGPARPDRQHPAGSTATTCYWSTVLSSRSASQQFEVPAWKRTMANGAYDERGLIGG